MGSTKVTVNWTRTGACGMTSSGWMITRSANGFMVFDEDERHVGTYETRGEAEQAAR